MMNGCQKSGMIQETIEDSRFVSNVIFKMAIPLLKVHTLVLCNFFHRVFKLMDVVVPKHGGTSHIRDECNVSIATSER